MREAGLPANIAATKRLDDHLTILVVGGWTFGCIFLMPQRHRTKAGRLYEKV
jgi:hypothetical protein